MLVRLSGGTIEMCKRILLKMDSRIWNFPNCTAGRSCITNGITATTFSVHSFGGYVDCFPNARLHFLHIKAIICCCHKSLAYTQHLVPPHGMGELAVCWNRPPVWQHGIIWVPFQGSHGDQSSYKKNSWLLEWPDGAYQLVPVLITLSFCKLSFSMNTFISLIHLSWIIAMVTNIMKNEVQRATSQ